MHLSFALFADAANLSQEGKLNVLGVFDALQVGGFPAVHPRATLVVRLKGGDPFVFGRGGEECEALSAAGIDCEVINGITSGLAAPTALGIPLTHRDVCHGAILITGHAGEDARTTPNWTALVATGLPLVIYMGVARCESIQQDLLDAGMAATMPVAVIKGASRTDQESVITTLVTMAADIRAANIGSPAIIVVGETVRYARTQVHAEDGFSALPMRRHI